MKGMSKSMKFFWAVLFLLALAPVDAFAVLSCPNKPANATTLATVHFDTSDGEGQLWEIYPGAGQIQQPAGAMGNVSASILYAGQPTGGQQTIYPKPGNQQPLSNLYFCVRWQMAPNFVGIRTSNKLMFSAAQDWPYSSSPSNGFFGANPVDTSNYPVSTAASGFFLYFGHNSGTIDNSHTCQLDLGLFCGPNLTTTVLRPGNWYTVEGYIIGSTSITSRDGKVSWWVDGVPQGYYGNINYSAVVNEWQINHTWDGSMAIQCYNASTAPLGRDCTNDQIHYFDEAVIASVGGLAPGSGGGGGGTTPPPVTLTISPSSQPNGRVGDAYIGTSLSTSGGTAPYTYSVSSGALPPGVSLSSSGVFSGTPTTAGSYNMTVTVTDSAGTPVSNTQSYTIVVDAAATPNQLTATLTWVDNATNESGYEVAYSINDGSYISEGMITPNSTTHALNIPLAGLYKVCAQVRPYRDNINAARLFGAWSAAACKSVDFIVPAQAQSLVIN